jgi:PAS domain-containing protein
MQNPLSFYPEYNSYSTGDAFLSNAPETSIESDVFGPTINTNQMPVITQATSSGMMTSKKRKATIDTDASYSPASIYSDNSNYSDTSYPTFSRRSTDFSQGLTSGRSGTMTTTSNLTTSAEEGSSDDNDEGEEENDLARKREKHTQVEAQRRALEKAHFKELSMLITSRNDSKSTKLHHLDLLKIAADRISEMNARHIHDPLRPSNLTDNELNFLTIEASNSFLFVTTIESSVFRVIHVSDSINRILNLTPEQWLGQNFFSFIHPEDALRVQSQLIPLNQRTGIKTHFECRIKQGNNDIYSSFTIDGMTKKIDHSLKPVQANTPGFLAFIGICHLPLITKYSETNMSLYKNPHLLTFRCRCSPHDWKIFLIDRSVSNLPSISYDLFRQKSILDYIPTNEQGHVHQALLRSTTASINETITCHFIHPTLQNIIPMTLEMKSFFNPIIHRADFIELTFKSLNNSINTKLETSILDFMNDTKEIDRLFEPDLSTAAHQQLDHHNPISQTEAYYYSNDWPTKNELF